MKKAVVFLYVLGCLVGCTRVPKTEIGGILPTDSANQKLYLEQVGAQRTSVIDSVNVGKDGSYRFRFVTQELPELYAVRGAGYKEYVVVDSLGVNEAETAQIASFRASLQTQPLDEHKASARDYILKNPRTVAAYYALLQQKDGLFIFNPYEKTDRQCYAAVATAWNAFYPTNTRTKVIYNLVDGIIQEERKLAQNVRLQELIANAENAFLDITLPNEEDVDCSLSALRGNVILLDFSAAEMEQSQAYIFALRELYNKYHSRGLEIYQVSADTNPIAWAQSAENLPWTTVRSPYGAYASCFQQYNVGSIPTTFLFNRKGEVIARSLSFDALPAAIEKCL